jgi:Cu2+-exporting ATPase
MQTIPSEQNNQINLETSRVECLHCGLPIPTGSKSEFCCVGCQTVHAAITRLGLTDFYKYRDAPGSPIKLATNYIDQNLLNEDLIKQSFTEKSDGTIYGTLQLEGIHCTGCVWIIEELPKLIDGVLYSSVDFALGTVNLVINPKKTSLSNIASLLASLGYSAKLVITDPNNKSSNIKNYSRSLLIKLGVASVCAMNTMMLATSLWQGLISGIEDDIAFIFRYLSAFLTLPVVFYCATPFYKNAWTSIKLRRLHIDLPIALAIIGAFLASLLNTIFNRNQIYFDSVCALTSLLLGGRYLQQRAVEYAQSKVKSSWSILPLSAWLVDKDFSLSDNKQIHKQTTAASITKGQRIIIKPGQRCPVDSVIIDGTCSVNNSVLTGESTEVLLEKGNQILAGSLCTDGIALLESITDFSGSRIKRILDELKFQQTNKGKITELTDLIGGYFIGAVLLLSILTFAYWIRIDLWQAVDSTVALLIVTCPCALGLAAPLAFTKASAECANNGILLKGQDVLERVTAIKHIFYDKTGTLTSGEYKVVSTIFNQEISEQQKSLLFSIVNSNYSHPSARAVLNWCNDNNFLVSQDFDCKNFSTILSSGLEYKIDNQTYRLGSVSFVMGNKNPDQIKSITSKLSKGQSVVLFGCNSKILTTFFLQDTIRPESFDFIEFANKHNIKQTILSGDRNETVKSVGELLGIQDSECLGELLPEDKSSKVKNSPLPSAFIGDGVNDCLAMQNAILAIGLSGGLEASLESTDVYIVDSDIKKIKALFNIAKATISRVKLAIAVSASYNLMAAPLAMFGYINPIWAAFVMPISSFSVLGVILVRARKKIC